MQAVSELEKIFSGKNIVLGVSGGIAAYKTVDLVSQIKKLGAEVNVVLTENAKQFVAPLSLEVMSKNKIHCGQYDSSWTEHIRLADAADLVLVAPATANCIAKMASGLSDNLLLDLLLATRAPVMIAPAMNTNMWQHPSVVKNIHQLKTFSYHVLPPDSGLLACGHEGEGRLPENQTIIEAAAEILAEKRNSRLHLRDERESPAIKLKTASAVPTTNQSLAGKKVVLTMGGTREYIDPVRFIANRSSGKMGLALAKALKEAGAKLALISSLDVRDQVAADEFYLVQSAEEMLEATHQAFFASDAHADALVMAAAVADYTPRVNQESKIKKAQQILNIELEPTQDILAAIARSKKPGQVIVGFALETDNGLSNAKAKLEYKNLDLLVYNTPAAFDAHESEVALISAENIEKFPMQAKSKTAKIVVERLAAIFTEDDSHRFTAQPRSSLPDYISI